MRRRYWAAGRQEKSHLLDEFVGRATQLSSPTGWLNWKQFPILQNAQPGSASLPTSLIMWLPLALRAYARNLLAVRAQLLHRVIYELPVNEAPDV